MVKKIKFSGDVDNINCECKDGGRLANNALQGVECKCSAENEETGQETPNRKIGSVIIIRKPSSDVTRSLRDLKKEE